MPYKDKEQAKAAARERQRKHRMSHPVTPDENVTPSVTPTPVTPEPKVTPDVTPANLVGFSKKPSPGPAWMQAGKVESIKPPTPKWLI